MAARLMPQNEGGPIIPLEKAITLIGRHPECDGVLPDNQKISRRHCCIALVECRLILRDLGSMNGITVNGEQVSEIDLNDGDEITIGDEDFILEVTPRSPGAKASPKPAKREADLDSPTPQKPKPAPRQVNVPTASSPLNRRQYPIDVSQEFPVPIAEDDELSSEEEDDDVSVRRNVNGRPPIPQPAEPIKFMVDVDEESSSEIEILKLDSGEIELKGFGDSDPK